jgi:hypothetical protein
MAAGMAAATLTHTPDALAIAPQAAELAWPTPGLVNTGLALLAASIAAYAGLIKAAQAVSTCQAACPDVTLSVNGLQSALARP